MISEKDEKYNIIVNNIVDVIIEIDLNGVINFVNSQMYDLLGFQRDELIGLKIFNFVHSDDVHNLTDSITKRAKQLDKFYVEFRIQHKQGNYIYVSMQGKLFNEKEHSGIIALLRDITDRKNIEQELSQSKAILRTVIENLPFDFFIIDENGRYSLINSTCSKNWGNILGKTPEEVTTDKDIINIWKNNKNRAFSGEVVKEEVHFKLRGDDKYIYNIITPIYDENKRQGILGVNIDITDLKLTELKLKDSEENFKLILENANDLITIINQKFEHEFINEKAYFNLLGYNKEDIIGKKPIEPVHPDDLLKSVENLRNGFKYGYGKNEIRLRHKNGHYLWLENKGTVFINKKGEKKALIISRDITERKNSEDKLRKSERSLSEAQRIAHIGHWEWDIRTNDLYWSEEMYRIYKQPKNFKPTIKEWLKQVHSDDFIKYFDSVRKNVADGDIYNRDLRIFCTDGELRYIHAEWEIYRDETEKPKTIFGTIHDITERKVIEEKLKQSEEKYRHLFENSPFSIILFNLKGIIQDCNPQTEKIFGYAKQDLIGKNYIELSGEKVEDLKIIKSRFLSILKGEDLEDIDIKTKKKNGDKIWVNSRISKIQIGVELLFYSIIQDITEKKILRNVMFEFNKNFLNFTSDVKRNILLLIQTAKNLSNGAIVLYARKFIKDEFEKVLILTSENETNEYDFDFLKNLFINVVFDSGHERPQIYSDLDQINYSSTDPIIKRYNIKMVYGKNISTDSNFKSGILILYKYNLSISYDIQLTLLLISDAIAIEEKRLQLLEKLEEQNKKLNEIDKLKSEFLRRISHELKTPLISIKGYSDLILNNYADDMDIDLISMIREIKQGSKRLENLITQLLESSKLESDQIKLRASLENLSFLIKFTVNELQGFAQTRNQKIILDIHDSLITKFEKERIYEVIGNLLTNAIKYTPPYGAILVKSEIKDDSFVISIKDNGIGFTEQEKNKLFQQFGKIERYGNGSYLEIEGSGLGLYISKKLIELHGGKIWMESEGRNKGSTFYFSLPIKNQ